MDSNPLRFIQAAYPFDLDGGPADAIELNDGRVIVIDGETLSIYEDLESALNPDEDEDGDQHLSIPLVIAD